MGLDSMQEPLFSEFSASMKSGPEYGEDFEKFSSMYKNQNIDPYVPQNGELKVFLFDAVEASRRVRNSSLRKGFTLFNEEKKPPTLKPTHRNNLEKRHPL